LAIGASEPQLKGYATLVSSKLPLMVGVKEMARLANDHLTWLVKKSPEAQTRSDKENAQLKKELSRLHGQLLHWNMLLDDLSKNVESLQNTIEHAWMDRMLYEQEQLRSEHELAAEIERSRQSRPTGQRPARFAYNLVMMVLAAAAVVVTVITAKVDLNQPGRLVEGDPGALAGVDGRSARVRSLPAGGPDSPVVKGEAWRPARLPV
jgi:hypothetical protein